MRKRSGRNKISAQHLNRFESKNRQTTMCRNLQPYKAIYKQDLELKAHVNLETCFQGQG